MFTESSTDETVGLNSNPNPQQLNNNMTDEQNQQKIEITVKDDSDIANDDQNEANPNPNQNQNQQQNEQQNKEQKEETSSHANADNVYTKKAHIFRRTFHVVTCIFSPIIYFWVGPLVADAIHIALPKILAVIMFITIFGEAFRIHKRFIIFGMREYEKYHVCANTWGIVGICIVLLLAFPRSYSSGPAISHDQNGDDDSAEANACFAQIAIPIIWTLGLGDPLLGELKRYVHADKLKAWVMYLIADLCISVVWIISCLWLGTPFWLCIIMPPIAIAAEKPSIKDIDDNGVMLLVPLLFTLMLEPWFSKKCDSVFY